MQKIDILEKQAFALISEIIVDNNIKQTMLFDEQNAPVILIIMSIVP